MPAVIFEYIQSFAIDINKSTEERRYITVTLLNGKVLKPIYFKVPAAITASKVDNFIKILRHGDTPNPFSHGINLIYKIVAIMDLMLLRG